VDAGFVAGQVSSDSGVAVVARGGAQDQPARRLAGCFIDGREPKRVKHVIAQMLARRIYGLALGYEYLCDHE